MSLYGLGFVGQIVQTPGLVVMLTETYHSFKLIPTDGRKHRDDVAPSFRGDSVGHWDGDTLVVDTTNFTDSNWMHAEGEVSFHSDALHIVERYRRVDRDTLEVDAVVEDPKVLTGPWKVPTQTLRLAPFDQIMEVGCTGVESAGADGCGVEGELRQEIALRQQTGALVGIIVAPAAVHPQPELRMAAHVHLEHVGAPLRELADRVRRCRSRRRLDRVLVDQPVASAAERQREHRHDRRAGAQRQRRHRRRRRRRPLEEVDVDRVAARECADRSARATPCPSCSIRITRRIVPCR